MPDEDARLTDFLPDDEPDADGGDDDGGEPGDGEEPIGSDGRDRSDEPDGSDVLDEPGEPDEPVAGDADVAPTVSTAAWHPDGAACDACGAVVQRRWRDDEGLVCVDCVEW